MDSWEVTKVSAAVLSALLLMVGTKTAIDISASHHGHVAMGYELPQAAPAEAGGKSGGAAGGFSFAKIAQLLPKADAQAGAAAFKKCATCHNVEKGAPAKQGPTLYGVVNRAKGSMEGFAYSQAMKEKGGDWNYEQLAGFIHDPKGWVPGTKMGFAGVKDDQELADIISYLRTLAPTPAPLPQG